MQVTDKFGTAIRSKCPIEALAPQDKKRFDSGSDLRKEIKSLTSLRFFACCVMVYYHVHGCFSWLPDLAKSFAFAHVLTFFFVLSGFILTYNYHNLSGARSTCLFYLARVARLWPCHVLSLILLIFLMPELFRVKWATLPVFLSNLFMIHSWIPSWKVYFSYNAPSWTNSTEMFFYICFPFLLAGFKRNKFLPVAVTAVIGITLVFVCIFFGLPELDPVGPCTHALTVVHPLARLFEFTVGMAAAFLFLRYFTQAQWSMAKATFFEIGAVGVLIWLTSNALSWRANSIFWAGIAGANWLYFIALPVAAVACLMTVLATEKGLLARILNFSILVLLGELSFAIYMIHSVLVAFRQVNYPQEQSVSSFLLFLTVIFLTAHFLWFGVEKPLRRVILKAGLKLIPFNEEPVMEPQILRQLKTKLKETKNHENPTQHAIAGGGCNIALRCSQAASTIGGWRPGKKALLVFAEAAALAGIFYLSLPAIHKVSPIEARAIQAKSSTGDVIFAPYLRLKAACASRSNSKVSLRIVWEALLSQSVNYFAIINVYDQSHLLLGSMTYSLSPRLEHVEQGTVWYDDLTIQTTPGGSATTVEMSLSRSYKHKLVATKAHNPIPLPQPNLPISVM